MSAHTPGPWTAADAIVVTTSETHGYMTWLANCSVGGAGNEEKLANAQLVAAAPELLSALQDALFLIEREVADGQYVGEAIVARAAISKATGQPLIQS